MSELILHKRRRKGCKHGRTKAGKCRKTAKRRR